MTYKRLTLEEKSAIVIAAVQGESIKELASQFGVSENTIRRTIKTAETEPEPTLEPKASPKIVKTTKPADPVAESESPEPPPGPVSPQPRQPVTRRKRSSTPPAPDTAAEPQELPVAPPVSQGPDVVVASDVSLDTDDEDADDLTGLAGQDLDDFGDEDFDDEEEDSDSADDPDEAAEMLAEEPSPTEIAIFPLEAAVLPKPCYLVIDTRSELLARPLAEFRGLGHAAQEEELQKTLPIFESRSVAMRFSQRNQRIYKNSESILRKTVIKVPDGNMLRKTTPYLQGKGITRLLIHGQVYALE